MFKCVQYFQSLIHAMYFTGDTLCKQIKNIMKKYYDTIFHNTPHCQCQSPYDEDS